MLADLLELAKADPVLLRAELLNDVLYPHIGSVEHLLHSSDQLIGVDASKLLDEFVVSDLAVTILVQVVEETFELGLVEVENNLRHLLHELGLRERSV